MIDGVLIFHQGNWDFYYGARWLPGQDFDSGQTVSSIATSDKFSSSALIATDGGEIS